MALLDVDDETRAWRTVFDAVNATIQVINPDDEEVASVPYDIHDQPFINIDMTVTHSSIRLRAKSLGETVWTTLIEIGIGAWPDQVLFKASASTDAELYDLQGIDDVIADCGG